LGIPESALFWFEMLARPETSIEWLEPILLICVPRGWSDVRDQRGDRRKVAAAASRHRQRCGKADGALLDFSSAEGS
jgi:hypothetical protein